jgi:hypothetical protein
MRTCLDIGEETEKSKARNMEFAEMRDNEGTGKSLVSRGIVYFRTSPGSNRSAVERQRNLKQSAGAQGAAIRSRETG